mgnify:FL=1
MVAASREASIPILKERVRKKMKLQHKPKTVLGNHDKAAKLIKWLVDQKMTRGLTTSTDSEFKIKIGTRYYWFNWGRLGDIAEGLTLFCETRGRKNADGKLIPESHSTLGKYRSALSHFRKKAFLKGIAISDADIAIHDAKVTAYFTGVERYEQKLKQDGIIPAQKGGTDFPIELFRETCKLAYEKCYKKPRVGLFNLMAWHTCGRSTNVANMHIEHFVLDGDCMGIQFPVTRRGDESDSEFRAKTQLARCERTCRCCLVCRRVRVTLALPHHLRWLSAGDICII